MTKRQVVAVKNAGDGEPLVVKEVDKAMTGLVPFEYDAVTLTYTGDNVTSVMYRKGGRSGRVVATLYIEYRDNKVIAVERK